MLSIISNFISKELPCLANSRPATNIADRILMSLSTSIGLCTTISTVFCVHLSINSCVGAEEASFSSLPFLANLVDPWKSREYMPEYPGTIDCSHSDM